MTSWKIELKVALDLIPMVEDILYGLNIDDFPTLSDFEIIEGDHIRLVEGYFTIKPDVTLLKSRLQDMIPTLDLAACDITLSATEDKDWVSESQKLLTPVDAGKFFVYGSHDADKVPADRISLLVEAGQAFGTGQHETTHGCLLAIGELSETLTGENAPRTALDLGCGSGLLALAMAKVWPITITASDIDPIATETTLMNAAANQVPVVALDAGTPGLAALTSDGFDQTDLGRAGPYDVIVANILAKPLQDMAADVVANLSPTGSLVLSGLLATQEDAVCAAYAEQGMILIKRYPRGEWHSLLLRRK
ncbi:50S ribosomal protein L11 methyltransferase [Paremcibacter congregatus]|uniref:Ribosomal protein L11 methyltransferase n=1 Tax=Paremcibacter congregatus TaxID=2043170 RepID=A0A2G4YRT3_9PROT|nr:50S ribosomal protein L11 methyltransferase [Paremcibacter congregatus]PHZ84970.1 50S ribosomal protein L11 methyltransferase [Paremcibacter congregatus]QDE26055.1 50S ribosomal protein L11 methyltransferase [Paremcibacter congregatus]